MNRNTDQPAIAATLRDGFLIAKATRPLVVPPATSPRRAHVESVSPRPVPISPCGVSERDHANLQIELGVDKLIREAAEQATPCGRRNAEPFDRRECLRKVADSSQGMLELVQQCSPKIGTPR